MSDTQQTYKLLLLGGKGAGKRSLLQRWSGKGFRGSGEDEKETETKESMDQVEEQETGIQFMIYNNQGRKPNEVSLGIYHDVVAVVVLYDPQDQEGFYSDCIVWLEEIQERLPGVPVLVGATKKDLTDTDSSICIEGYARKASNLGGEHVSISSKTGENTMELLKYFLYLYGELREDPLFPDSDE